MLDVAFGAALAPFRTALALLAAQGQVWAVGGLVRDTVRGKTSVDLDVAIDGDALPLAQALADTLGGSFVALDEGRATARVVLDAVYIDIARLRAPTLAEDLALRDVTANALALAIRPDGTPGALIDPLGGQAAIAASKLVPCGPDAIAADPLRALRAVRFATAFGWEITPELDSQIRAHAAQVAACAAERIRIELLAILGCRWAAPAIAYLAQTGVLTALIPELLPLFGHTQPRIHFLDVWNHTVEAICAGEWLVAQLAGTDLAPPPERVWPPADPAATHPPNFFAAPVAAPIAQAANLRWADGLLRQLREPIGATNRLSIWKLALLLHDNAKPETRINKPDGGVGFYGHEDVGAEHARAIAARLRLSRAETALLTTIIAGHMRPGQLQSQPTTTPRATYRFFRDLGPAGCETLLHALADHLATRGPMLSHAAWEHHLRWTDAMLDAHWGEAAEKRKAHPLIDGRALIEVVGVKPGQRIGAILAQLREAEAIGEITSYEEALALARQLDAQG